MNGLAILAATICGWLCGSGLNFWIDWLLASRTKTGVICVNCGQKRNWIDYLWVRPCSQCGQARSSRDWALQIGLTILLPVLWAFPPRFFGFWIALPYMLYFALVLTMDIEHRVILHEVSILGAVLAIPLGLYWNGWLKTLLGGASGFGIMLALYGFGLLFNKALSRRRGEPIEEVALGFGDVNLSGVLGILLGWPKIGLSLFFSVMAGGVFSGLYLLITALIRKYRAFSAFPYAPFLVLSAVVLMYLAK